jgi:hypothetical protein
MKDDKREESRRWLLEQAEAMARKMAAFQEKEYGPLGSTTEEILSHENDNLKGSILGALCHRIGQKAGSRGESSLTETERRLCAAYFFEGEVMNGGFDQYFFNSAGDYAEAALGGLREMDSTAVPILERAMAVFPGGKPPADRKERNEVMTKMESQSKPVWDKCDSEFYARKEDIGRLCLEYAKKKRAEIILP